MPTYSNTQPTTPMDSKNNISFIEFALLKNGKPLHYCINIDHVVEISEFPKTISEVSSKDSFVYGIINIRKNIFLPLYNIAYRLQLDHDVLPNKAKVIVLYLNSSLVAILVNQVNRIHTIPQNNITASSPFINASVPCTSGYFKVNNKIIQILDIEDLLQTAQTNNNSNNNSNNNTNTNNNNNNTNTTVASEILQRNILLVHNSHTTSNYIKQALHNNNIANNTNIANNNHDAMAILEQNHNELPSIIICTANSEGNKLIHQIQHNNYTMPIIAIPPTHQSDQDKHIFQKQMDNLQLNNKLLILNKPTVTDIANAVEQLLSYSEKITKQINHTTQ